jgi:hypothetical protein
MPEAAVHEQGGAPPVEDEVRLSRQISAMKPKAKSQRMRCSPDIHLGAGVFRFDLRHRPGTMGGIAFPCPSRNRPLAGPSIRPFCTCSPRCSVNRHNYLSLQILGCAAGRVAALTEPDQPVINAGLRLPRPTLTPEDLNADAGCSLRLTNDVVTAIDNTVAITERRTILRDTF